MKILIWEESFCARIIFGTLSFEPSIHFFAINVIISEMYSSLFRSERMSVEIDWLGIVFWATNLLFCLKRNHFEKFSSLFRSVAERRSLFCYGIVLSTLPKNVIISDKYYSLFRLVRVHGLRIASSFLINVKRRIECSRNVDCSKMMWGGACLFWE